MVAQYADGRNESFRVLTHDRADRIPNSTPSQHTLTSFVQLSDAALGKLGLDNEDDLVIQYQAYGGPQDGAFVQGVLRSWGLAMIGNGMVSRSEIPEGIDPAHFIPTFVTDGLGRKRLFAYETKPGRVYDSAYAASEYAQIDQMIPILVRQTKNAGSLAIGDHDLVFWYKPTAEFLAALPASVRESLGADQTSSVSPSQHSHEGSLAGSRAYPNPSLGQFKVHFEHAPAAEVHASLRDLLGKDMGIPTSVMNQNEMAVDASNVPAGIYLLQITTDSGDEMLQRIVIAK